MRRGVVIRTVINGLTFDGATRDPMQQAVRDALIAFMAATAQAQADQAADVRSRQLRPAPPARSPCGMIHANCGRAALLVEFKASGVQQRLGVPRLCRFFARPRSRTGSRRQGCPKLRLLPTGSQLSD